MIKCTVYKLYLTNESNKTKKCLQINRILFLISRGGIIFYAPPHREDGVFDLQI